MSKWTRQQEERLRDALATVAAQEARIARLEPRAERTLAVERELEETNQYVAEVSGEVERLRGIIEKIALLERTAAQAIREEQGSVLITQEAAERIVEIRDLYAKDGTDADLLASAAFEIREARRLTPRRAAVAMQSDALDAALARAAGLEESVEIAKAAMHDALRERDAALRELGLARDAAPAFRLTIPGELSITIRGGEAMRYHVLGFDHDSERGLTTLDLTPVA